MDVIPTAAGTFATNEGTITVGSDAPYGYELSMKSSNGSNALTSGTDSIPSITGEIEEATFKSDTITRYRNTWGFKPSKKNGVDNTKYLPGPTATPVIIDKTSGPAADATNYTITIGVKVDGAQPVGKYSQDFIVSAWANGTHYTIVYDDNGGYDGPGIVSGEKDIEDPVILSSETPKKSGYIFLGWCSQPTYC